jgi:hypothetical protein
MTRLVGSLCFSHVNDAHRQGLIAIEPQ